MREIETFTAVLTPGVVDCHLACPECGIVSVVPIEVMAELVSVKDMEGIKVAELKPKVKAKKIAHRCEQLTVDHVARADRVAEGLDALAKTAAGFKSKDELDELDELGVETAADAVDVDELED
jgi:hypothetical protein